MSLCDWIVRHLLPHHGPEPDATRLEAAFAAADSMRRETAAKAQQATAAADRHRRAVEAERTRIQARTDAAEQKRRVGQTAGAKAAVEDLLDKMDRRPLRTNRNTDP